MCADKAERERSRGGKRPWYATRRALLNSHEVDVNAQDTRFHERSMDRTSLARRNDVQNGTATSTRRVDSCERQHLPLEHVSGGHGVGTNVGSLSEE